MAGQTEGSGERRRALDAERAGSGRRVAGHVAPVLPVDSAPPAALSPASSPAPAAAARDPFTTPPAGAPVVRPATGAHASASAPTPPLGTPLPSRRDRVALRRPTALDEAAVQASDTAAWRTSPALEDPRTASAIARPSPLTHALARTLTEHLESLTPPAGLSSTPPSASSTSAPSSSAPSSRSAGALREAPSVYVPRRRPAPAVSGPLPVVSATTTPAESRREPSWTTEPVAPRWSGDHTEPELPPPPPAAEVEAAARARAARFSTAPVPPPMPDRVSPALAGRTSIVVPGLPTTGLPPVSGPAAALAAADLAVLRAVTAGHTAATAAAPAAAASTPSAAASTTSPTASTTASTTALPAEPRHGRPSRYAAARTDRTVRTDRAARAAGRRWHQRPALRLPMGVQAAAVALTVITVIVFAASDTGHDLAAALTSSSTTDTPGTATPPAAIPAADDTASAAPKTTEDARKTNNSEGAEGAAAPAAGDQQKTAADPPASSAPATAAASEPATSPRTAPLGDVTYEGFGTAKSTYVELGTKDSREVHQDLGATFTKAVPDSKSWPGWYVAVRTLGEKGDGTVGCRIKDADGTVLVEERSQDGLLAVCLLGSPPGIA